MLFMLLLPLTAASRFEKYFYATGSIAQESEQDKIVLKLMVRF